MLQEPESNPLIGPDGIIDDSSRLMGEARERIRREDEQNKEGVKLARRLVVAFILVLILGVVFYVVLPQYGLRLDPMVPLLSFLAILAGAILTAVEENKDSDDPDDPDNSDDEDGSDDSRGSGGCGNDGCAVGMCSGPRPLRMFRHPKKK